MALNLMFKEDLPTAAQWIGKKGWYVFFYIGRNG